MGDTSLGGYALGNEGRAEAEVELGASAPGATRDDERVVPALWD